MKPTSHRRWKDTDEGCLARSRHLESQRWLLWLPPLRFHSANQNCELANVCRARGLFPLAEAHYLRALRLLGGGRPWRTKRSFKRHSLIAACHYFLGMLRLRQQLNDEAAEEFDKAIAVRRELFRLFPGPGERDNQVYLGGALYNRGHACAHSDPAAARSFYTESLLILRQPKQTCACSYWDAERESWWCSQLEAMGQALGMPWVALAPVFVDEAMQGLASLKST